MVTELDGYLVRDETVGFTEMVQRARDEIVALRTQCALHDDLEFVSKNELTQARNEALEEAARVCEGGYTTGSTASTLKAIAATIRALKRKG